MIKKILTLEKRIVNIVLKHINVILICFMLLTIYLSTIPGIVEEEESLSNTVYLWVPPNLQSIGHVIFYGILSLLWCIYLNKKNLKYTTTFVIAFIITATFGIINEIAQIYIPGRDAIILDAVLNTIGAGLGLWAFDKRVKALLMLQ